MLINKLDVSSCYFDMINNAVEFVEREFPVKILFGGIIGSVGYELHNDTSDIDMILFYSSDFDIDPSIMSVLNKAVLLNDLIGVIMFNIKLLNSVNLPSEQIDASISPNYIKPHFNFDYDILPDSTNCRLCSAVTETLFCRKIWDERGYLSTNMMTLKKFLTVYDFMKRQYIYAQGRLDKYLVDNEVRLRTYLYTARDILSIEHILAAKEFPTLDFITLLNECHNSEAKNILFELHYKNIKAGVDKTKLMIQPIALLNQYFSDRLQEIKPNIETFYTIYRNDVFDIAIM